MASFTVLRERLRNALARLYPGVWFDLNHLKEEDHEWHDGGDDLIDRWHVTMRRKERARLAREHAGLWQRLASPVPVSAGGDDIPF